MTKEMIAEKHGITVEQVDQLIESMAQTWDIISGDWHDIVGPAGWAGLYGSEAEMVAEATLDADRITTHNPGKDLSWLRRSGLKVMELGIEVRSL
jgi:hypothetical protein